MTANELRAEDEGATAAWDGYKRHQNPYSPADDEHCAWERGRQRGEREMLIEQDCANVDDVEYESIYG